MIYKASLSESYFSSRKRSLDACAFKHNENYQLIGDGDKFLEWGILQESEVSCDSTFMIRKLLQRTVDYPRGKVSGLTDYRVNLDVTRSAPLEISK